MPQLFQLGDQYNIKIDNDLIRMAVVNIPMSAIFTLKIGQNH
jgi:hypothetical protein